MTLEELSVIFSADISPFAAAMDQLSGIISQAGAQADQLAACFQSAGIQAGEGLRGGLLAQRGAVAAAAAALAGAAAGALQSALRIHSPSRLTYEVGRFFDEGLMHGIAGSAARVEKEAGNLGQRAADALSAPEIIQPILTPEFLKSSQPAGMESALSPISITIPLEIDGYRLGVAAIEGINRVTHGTGKIELLL